jgi:hypothetical protein
MSDTTIERIADTGQAAEAVPASDEQLVAMLVDRARSVGLQLTGEGGLLQQLTKKLLESALEGEITDHSDTRSTKPRAGAAATPATAPGRRRC